MDLGGGKELGSRVFACFFLPENGRAVSWGWGCGDRGAVRSGWHGMLGHSSNKQVCTISALVGGWVIDMYCCLLHTLVVCWVQKLVWTVLYSLSSI